MIATVTSVNEGREGRVQAIVRRNHRSETLYGSHFDLKVGDRVEVVRKTNNPYLVRVESK
jgi:hypothetical protein